MSQPGSDFETFVLSLASSAMLHLGAVPDPDTGEKSCNLPMAKHTIALLEMLAEKTRGNLSQTEGDLLARLLYDLRKRFIERCKAD
ncbi:MAG: hypothetical protein ACI9OJ_001725 [Myxococcota bacterium]|jgi:hypothetical protein